MSKIKVEKTSGNYSIMTTYHLRDKGLSLQAKGLMTIMLSLPEDWDYSGEGLQKLSLNGITVVRTVLTELQSKGYLTRKPLKDNGKILDWEYTLYEKPQVDFPQVEKPQVEFPQVENLTQYNIKEHNIKELSIKELKENKKESCDGSLNVIKAIINYLNERLKTTYRYTTPSTQLHIRARLKEKFTLQDFKTVIDDRIEEWGGSSQMRQFIRPETLFGTKFESYLNFAKNKPQENKQDCEFDS